MNCQNNGDGTITKTYATNADKGQNVMFARIPGAPIPSISHFLYRTDGVSTYNEDNETDEEIGYC